MAYKALDFLIHSHQLVGFVVDNEVQEYSKFSIVLEREKKL